MEENHQGNQKSENLKSKGNNSNLIDLSGMSKGGLGTDVSQEPKVPDLSHPKDINMESEIDDETESKLLGGDLEDKIDEKLKDWATIAENESALQRLRDIEIQDNSGSSMVTSGVSFSSDFMEKYQPKVTSSALRRERLKRYITEKVQNLLSLKRRGDEAFTPPKNTNDNLDKRLRTYASMASESLKVMVLDGQTTVGDITEEAYNNLRAFLSDKIDNLPKEVKQPTFENTGFIDGRGWFHCSNEETLKWLKSVISELNGSMGYKLFVAHFERKVPL